MIETRGVSAPASPASRDTWFWRPLAAICVLAFFAAALNQQPFPQAAWLVTALNFYSLLAYAATSALLFGTLRADPRRAIVILAATTLGMAIFKALTSITLPLTSTLPSIVPAGPQVATWLFFFQYVFFKFGALEYAASRRTDAGRPPPRKSIAVMVAAALAVVAAFSIVAFALGGDLPALKIGDAFAGMRTSGVGYIQLILSVVAIAAMLRVRHRDEMDRAVLLSVIAIALVDAVGATSLHRYTIGYFFLRTLSASAATFVLLTAVRRVVRAYYRLPLMQATLDRTERLAVRQSDRLATVWRLVNDEGLEEGQRIQAILDAGATAIRPGVPFFGSLRRIEDDELVIEVRSEAFASTPGVSRRFARNDRIPTESSFGADIIAARRTIAFSDYGRVDKGAMRAKRANSSEWESVIGTTFVVANTRYVLSFASVIPVNNEPFTDDDLAFIDVLASFLASRLHHGRQSAQIRYQIEHDLLTGLPTRASFRANASHLITEGIPCAIAVIDLDRFREVNETFGHMIGDAMLVEIAAALNGARREGEIVARIGGDNFGILIDNVTTPVDVEARLQPYRAVFSRPLVTGDRTGREALFLGASIGVALFPQDAATFADVLAGADSAVDDAKSRQRGSIAFYNQAFEASVQRRRTMRLELANAIDNGQLELYYQPMIELATGDVAGVEALVRWEHPTLGSVAPSEFIPMAENNTLIRPISTWVFRQALHDITALGILPPSFKVFLNLSGYQLRAPEFLAAMRLHLGEQPKAFGHIAVDINETVAMHDPDRTLDVMAVLRELNMEIALDDFGTGYSALSYVTRFPINIIKIDGRFIHLLPGDGHDSALVEVLLGTAQRFGFFTHAEGIETREQLGWLRERGCTYGQGYYIAKPMDFAALIRWLGTAQLMETAAVSAFRPPS
jgi:diguanylate cyclase (GGDEF)-like protein